MEATMPQAKKRERCKRVGAQLIAAGW